MRSLLVGIQSFVGPSGQRERFLDGLLSACSSMSERAAGFDNMLRFLAVRV